MSDNQEDDKLDLEFKIMGVIVRSLRKLPPEAKKRVVAWVWSKFGNSNG